MQITSNFADYELWCKHCGKVDMDSDFMEMLQIARELAGIPFIITSGYRCGEHNAAVGGVPDSSHVRGLAVDIRVRNNNGRYIILKALLEAGFTRIGIGDGFLHVDNDTRKTQDIIWTYY